MNEYERVAFEDLLTYLESAKVTATVIGARYACKSDYNKALMFESLKNRLYAEIQLVRTHMNIEEELNNENCN